MGLCARTASPLSLAPGEDGRYAVSHPRVVTIMVTRFVSSPARGPAVRRQGTKS